MPHQIYICYTSKDKPIADEIVSELELRGIKCWLATRDLKPGASWGRAISDAIESSQMVSFIFSNHANDSRQVMREIEMAVSKGLTILPIRVEDAQPTGSLKYFLSMTHWIDCFPQPMEAYLDRVAETIQIHLGLDAETKKAETPGEEEGHPKEKDKKGGLFKRMFRRFDQVGHDLSTDHAEAPKPDVKTEHARLNVVDAFEVQGLSSRGVIQFCVGDVTQASPKQAVDVLVTSAYRDQYYPVPGSVFGSLFRKGISVEDLARNKDVDLRGAFSCWLSQEIIDPPEGVQFKRILCYEPEESAKAGEQIGDIFRSLAPFIGGQDPIRSVGTTLVASGASRRITQKESLLLLVEAAAHWMSSGLPIETFKIVCLPNQDVEELTQLFAELKSKYASIASERQTQFSYDCFISYSHQDTREVELFIDLLLAQNRDLRIFIDKKDLNPGSAWQREIYEAIDDCSKVATFYSPTYLNSKVCLEEFNIALCRHRESEESILKPIYLYSANLPTYMRLIQYFDCRESNRDKLKQAAVSLLENDL